MSILSSLLSLGQGKPVQQIPQTVSEPKIAEEVAPFIKDILGKGQALYKQRMEEGFVPFEGQTLADVTADQLAAQEGLKSLVGTQAGGLQEARDLVRRQTQEATAETLQPFMNPYQQAVTDIAKRQAQERFEQETLPGLRKQAIDAGAFGGSRAAMRESQAQDAQARLLADIQAKGDLAAFQDARQAFEAQKTRERQAAEGLSGLTGREFEARRAELGGLEAVGREQQQRQQQLLDESYQRFLQERAFPEQQLGAYQAIVQGASPLLGSSQITTAPQTFQPSPIASALGTAGTALGTYKAARDLNLFGSSEGGPVIPAEEGTPGGLRGIMIKIIRAQRGKGGDPRSKRSEEIRTRKQQEDVTRMLEEMDMKAGGLIDLPILRKEEGGEFNIPGVRYTPEGEMVGEYDEETGRFFKSPGEKLAFIQSGEYSKMKKEMADKEEAGAERQVMRDEQLEANKLNQEVPMFIDNNADGTNAMTVAEALQSVIAGGEASKAALGEKQTLTEEFAKSLKQLGETEQEGLKQEREQLKKDKAIDFIMGVSKGLLKGGTRGGLLADLTRGGEEGVEAVKEYSDKFRQLGREERALARNLLNDQFNAAMEKLNIQLEKGEIDRKTYESRLQLLQVNKQISDETNVRIIQSMNLSTDVINNFKQIGDEDLALKTLNSYYKDGTGPMLKEDYDTARAVITGEKRVEQTPVKGSPVAENLGDLSDQQITID